MGFLRKGESWGLLGQHLVASLLFEFGGCNWLWKGYLALSLCMDVAICGYLLKSSCLEVFWSWRQEGFLRKWNVWIYLGLVKPFLPVIESQLFQTGANNTHRSARAYSVLFSEPLFFHERFLFHHRVSSDTSRKMPFPDKSSGLQKVGFNQRNPVGTFPGPNSLPTLLQIHILAIIRFLHLTLIIF